ncbi:hypothetical protein PoB_005297200 [Plakobranchus ocellatus]|uniref:Uncharacterized protein n=1 Tax=Plakobranchus ocellatus TaxID=259542 RepID=A0AAV4C526_9GAST|nr:hypothetical protein PoB_005297200 [Plakobranchus ocellatus]
MVQNDVPIQGYNDLPSMSLVDNLNCELNIEDRVHQAYWLVAQMVQNDVPIQGYNDLTYMSLVDNLNCELNIEDRVHQAYWLVAQMVHNDVTIQGYNDLTFMSLQTISSLELNIEDGRNVQNVYQRKIDPFLQIYACMRYWLLFALNRRGVIVIVVANRPTKGLHILPLSLY